MLKGIEYVVSAGGHTKAVIIDLKRHGRVWEDFYDRLLAEQRKDEIRESLDDVRQRLGKRENLSH